jgi:cell division protein FtsQ
LRRRRSLILTLSGVVLLVTVGWWIVAKSSLLTVRDFAVSGQELTAPDDVIAASGITTGVPMASVDLAAAANRIAGLAPIESATVTHGWPSTISIRVVERTPVAVTASGPAAGVVDKAGVVFSAPNPGLPVVALPASAMTTPAALAALGVLAQLPADLRAQVQTVSAASPDSVKLGLRGGASVTWGGVNDSARKVVVLKALLPRGAAAYDVSAPGLPTTRTAS